MRVRACVAVWLLAGGLAPAEEFNWSWGKAEPKAGNGVQPTNAERRAGESFKWEWEKGAGVGTQGVAAAAEARDAKGGVERSGARRLDAGAYGELLNENLELRRQAEAAAKARDEIRAENARLSTEIEDLERRIAQMATLYKQMKGAKADASAAPVDGAAVEAKLKAAEEQRARLEAELDAARKQLASAEQAPPGTNGVSRAPPPLPPHAVIEPGSDLFREVQKENASLKEHLRRLEAERIVALKDRDEALKRGAAADEEIKRATVKQRELSSQVERVRTGEQRSTKVLGDLLARMPAMEKELSEMQAGREKQAAQLGSRDRQLQSLEAELRQREHRLVKAERMAEMLRQTREEVRKAGDREKRDMHYNMAVIYAKEGRCAEAEAEYLHALRIDPTDADAHYNLAVLYDEELRNKSRAVMHYRSYLKLRPHAPDVDAVRDYLMKIEVVP